MSEKKRHIISIEKMQDDLRKAFNEKYPDGLESCEEDIKEYHKPTGDSFYAITIELPEDIYLVKIPVERDSFEDVENWLDREGESEIEQIAGSSTVPEAPDDTIPGTKELEDLSSADEEEEKDDIEDSDDGEGEE